MKSNKKIILALALSLSAISTSAIAEEYTGYVSQVLTGPSASTTFNTALVGMSATDGGSVDRYIFTSDSDYVNMIVNARVNHEVVSVTFASGVANGVHYR